MNLKINRHWFSDVSTIGEMLVNGAHECFTLEDVSRGKNVKLIGKTCIPDGEYPVVIDFSDRFKRPMPHVLKVPMFEGIRIHSGNTSEDTHGCILVGEAHSWNSLEGSKKAFDKLFDKITTAIHKGETVCLTIENIQIGGR